METVKTHTRYIRDGRNTEYDINLPITDRNGIDVYINNEHQDRFSYEILGSDSDLKKGYGRILMSTRGKVNDSLLFYRATMKKRKSNFDQSGRLNAKILDEEFNNLLLMTQDQAAQSFTNLHLPTSNIHHNLNTEVQMPTKSDQYLKSVFDGEKIRFEFSELDDFNAVSRNIESMVKECESAKNEVTEISSKLKTETNPIEDLSRKIGVNIDDLVETRRYVLRKGASNLPINERGLLTVHSTGENSVQSFLSYESANQFFRYIEGGRSSWSEWHSLIGKAPEVPDTDADKCNNCNCDSNNNGNNSDSSNDGSGNTGGGSNAGEAIKTLYDNPNGPKVVTLNSNVDIKDNDEIIVSVLRPGRTAYLFTFCMIADHRYPFQKHPTYQLTYEAPYSPSPSLHKFSISDGKIVKIQRKRH